MSEPIVQLPPVTVTAPKWENPWAGFGEYDWYDPANVGLPGGASGMGGYVPQTSGWTAYGQEAGDSDYARIHNELLKAENARRAAEGKLPVSTLDRAELESIVNEAQRKTTVLNSNSSTLPGHGVLDPTNSSGGGQSGLGNWGIGIPGVIGLGLGGLVYGGLLGGGGGGGGGSAGQGQATTPIFPPAIPGNPPATPGETQNPTVVPPVVPPPSPGVTGTITPRPGPVENPPGQLYPVGTGNPTKDPNLGPGPTTDSRTSGDTPPRPVLPTPTPPPTPTAPGESTRPTIVPVAPPPTTVMPTSPTSPTGDNYTINLPQYTAPTAINPFSRDYYDEGFRNANALQRLAPQMQGLYRDQSQGYGQSDFDRYAGLTGQVGNQNNYLTGQSILQTNLSNTGLRMGNTTDAATLGQQQLDQLKRYNPTLYAQLSAQDARSAQGIGVNQYQSQLGGMLQGGGLGSGPIMGQLEGQAMNDLSLGRSLSAQDQRGAQQAARSAYAARGLGDSNSAVAAEVLNLDSMGRQREAERRSFAQGVDQQGFGQRATGYGQNSSLGLNLANLDYGRQQQEFANQNTAIQNQNQTAFNPFASQYMQNSQNVGLNQQLFGNATGFSSGAYGNQYVQNAFNPYNNYSQDVYNSNFNAANARSIATQNNQAAIQGANTQANNALLGSFINVAGPSIWDKAAGIFGFKG